MGFYIYNLFASCIAEERSKEERRQKEFELIRGLTNYYVDVSAQLAH